MKLVIDIEADSLIELTLDGKGQPIKEAEIVHCVVTKDVDTGAVRVFTGKDLGDALRDHIMQAEWLIGHNLYGFDIQCLIRLCAIPLHQKIFDSLVVSKLMYPDRQNHPLGGNSLKDWGKKLGNEKMDFNGPWSELSQEMITYCIQDVHVAHEIYEYQLDKGGFR